MSAYAIVRAGQVYVLVRQGKTLPFVFRTEQEAEDFVYALGAIVQVAS